MAILKPSGKSSSKINSLVNSSSNAYSSLHVGPTTDMTFSKWDTNVFQEQVMPAFDNFLNDAYRRVLSFLVYYQSSLTSTRIPVFRRFSSKFAFTDWLAADPLEQRRISKQFIKFGFW
jgi:hypothetical protein